MEQRETKDRPVIPAADRNAAGTKSRYSGYLAERRISFTDRPPYLLSGKPQGNNAWLIHITVIPQQFYLLIGPLLELLKGHEHAFAIPVDAVHHSSILDGRAGFDLTGKVVTVYVNRDEEAMTIAQGLIRLTRNLKGPAIPGAYPLSGCVAVSYGVLFQSDQLKHALFYQSNYAGALRSILAANGKAWPFQRIKPLKIQREPRLLNWQYIPLTTLKSAPKGDVIKTFKINAVYNMGYCVLKQGRKYQSLDNNGRDILDRLQWQYRVHRFLEDKKVLPRAIEYFELYGDGFLAMEFIEGTTLGEKAISLSEGKLWKYLDADRKRELLGYILQVIRLLTIFHETGIVHRDVTPANFLVAGENRVIAIDIELSCDIRSGLPSPPFTLGTPGYMPPDQLHGGPPSIQDDIYGLGAMLISLLTGILPHKFNTASTMILTDALDHFIDSCSLVTMIAACVHPDPARRPGLQDMAQAISWYNVLLLTDNQGPDDNAHDTVTEQEIRELTGAAAMIDRTPGPGIAEEHRHPEAAMDKLEGMPLGISGGAAGSGLSILALTDNDNHAFYTRELAAIVRLLTTKQQPDGSWPLKIPGFFHGAAGIIYFLLEYYARFQSPDVRACIITALNWLKQQRVLHQGRWLWPVRTGHAVFDPWLEHGFSGIALTFVKAYEIMQDEEYRAIATAVLRYHPLHLTSNYFSISNGLSGLGEIYLEACNVFGDENWRIRAQNLAAVLYHSSYRDHKGTCYWLDGTQLQPLPDFLTGNSGIIHFLSRCISPEKVSFPVHLIK